MRNLFAIFGIIALVVAFAMGGINVFGRVALALGMPRLAAVLFEDPNWRGIAYYKAQSYRLAEESFVQAGPVAAYNLGNVRVRQINYPAALEAYDLAKAHSNDSDAAINFDLVFALYAGTRIDPDSVARWGTRKDGDVQEAEIAQGSARASGTGDDVTNTGATIGVPAFQSRDQLQVRRVYDDKFVVASPRWLATLSDVPGEYLAARILHEHKRRRKAGIGQVELDAE